MQLPPGKGNSQYSGQLNRAIRQSRAGLQTSVAQLILQRWQATVAFPEPDHEVGPHRSLGHPAVKVPHLGQVDARLLVVVPAARLDQPLCLFPVDFQGSPGTCLRRGSGYSHQLVATMGKNLLLLSHRFQRQIYVTFFQMDICQHAVLPGGGPLGQQLRA